MELVSSFMDDLTIQKGAYHTITFESSYMQKQFRQLVLTYFNRTKQSDYYYLHILDEIENEIKSNDFYFIAFDCNVVNLQEEKNTKQLLQELLYYHLENNPDLIQECLMFNEQINDFVNRMGIMNGNLMIDFRPSEKTISQFVKSLDISFAYKEKEYIPNHILRKFLIESMLELNTIEKEVFLLISFPETDIGSEDFMEFAAMLKKLRVTTLIITTQSDILTAADEENMFLVNKNGGLYDIIKLKSELIAFGLAKDTKPALAAKALAFRDFKKDYFLLDDEMKTFLQSNKF